MKEVLSGYPISSKETLINSKAASVIAASILSLALAACDGEKKDNKPAAVQVNNMPVPLPNAQPLDGEFPMLTGEKVLKILSDRTLIKAEKAVEHNVIYAVKDNRKVKFVNLNKEQQARLLEQQSFKELQQFAIVLAAEVEKTEEAQSKIDGGRPKQNPKNLRILIEGQIDACLSQRYRRGALLGNPIIGTECIWNEKKLNCVGGLMNTPRSKGRRWFAGAVDGRFKLVKGGQHPKGSTKGYPGIKKWLGSQPKCADLKK